MTTDQKESRMEISVKDVYEVNLSN